MCTFIFLGDFMNIKYMNLALKQAEKAYFNGEIPVGAVIVKNGCVISKAYNTKKKYHSAINHAEILAIIKASKKINNWRLSDCEMYVTLEPCPMCASAIKQSRIKCVYAALGSNDDNNYHMISKIFESDSTNPSVEFYNDVLPSKSKKLLQNFFSNRRTM